MTQEEQYQRATAYMNYNPLVMFCNCEECGRSIPVELKLCDACIERLEKE